MSTRLCQLVGVAIAVTTCGCYGPGQPITNALIAVSNFNYDKALIEQTHTDITVHGHVVDETGEPIRGLNYYSVEDRGFGGAMVLVAIGWREHARLWGGPEATEYPSLVETIGYNFDIEMSNIEKLTLIVVKPGYETAYFDVTVPQATKGRPAPVSVDKTITLHHARNSGTL